MSRLSTLLPVLLMAVLMLPQMNVACAGATYIVQPSDALFRISHKFNTTVVEPWALTLDALNLGERKGSPRVQAGKGTKQRKMPLNGQAINAPKGWADVRPETDHRQVFMGNDLPPLRPRGVQERIQELGRLANVAVTPHYLRHSVAKNLINAGVGLEKVAALLGHSSVAVTQRYTTQSEMDLEEAVAQIGD